MSIAFGIQLRNTTRSEILFSLPSLILRLFYDVVVGSVE